MNNLKTIGEQLRGLFSGSESFMNGGHQILKPSRARIGPRRKKADWARSDAAVQKLLLTAFPKLHTNPVQRARAGRWLLVIYLYFRQGMSYSEVAGEIGVTKKQVSDIIRRIFKTLDGYPANGGRKPRKRAVTRP